MAQIKRKKINRASTKGQGKLKAKETLKSKKFWIIFSSIVLGLAIIGVAIGLIVYFVTADDDENEIQDYFGGEATNLSYDYTYASGDKTTVSFHKMSYEGVMLHNNSQTGSDTNDTLVNYIFVFAADLSSFYADKAIDDGKDKTDDDETFYYNETANKVFNQLVKLQAEIDLYNENHDDYTVQLYIVDTSVGNNASILASGTFGGSDDNESSYLFSLIDVDSSTSDNNGGVKGPIKSYINEAGKTASVWSSDLNEIATTMVNNALILMNTQNFDLDATD